MRLRKALAVILIFSMLPLIFPAQALSDSDTYYSTYSTVRYTLIHQVTVSNNQRQDTEDIVVNIPLISNDQPAYQQLLSENLLPVPNEIITDESGTRYAVYRIPVLAPGEKIIFEQRYVIDNSAIRYQINAEEVSVVYDGGVDPKYLLPEEYIESNDPAIINYAQKFSILEDNPYVQAKLAFAEINTYLTYGFNGSDSGSALQAFRSKLGTCKDYTALYVAVLRSLGIPARQQTGYLYQPDIYTGAPFVNKDTGYINLLYMPHTWTEFYIPDIGWIVVDPTFTYMVNVGGSEKKLIDWEHFAAISREQRHIFFSEGAALQKINYTYRGAAPTVSFDAGMYPGEHGVAFSDIVGHWARNDIQYLYDYSAAPLIRGIEPGIFGTEKQTTRAEIAVLLYRLKSLQGSGSRTFPDVDATHWAAAEISAVADMGWLVGYPNGDFRPDAVVTRAEMAAILVRVFGITSALTGNPFSDLEAPEHSFAKQSIIVLANNGLVAGKAPGKFAPEDKLTRAEMAALLSRMIKYENSRLGK